MNLIDFVIKAKKDTYASGKSAKKLDDGFEEFTYTENDLVYHDRYHARDPRPFGGEEVVWKNGKAVWIMNYYGFVLDTSVDSGELYGFLRKAMSLISHSSPFRGPENFKCENFEYRNMSTGNFERFTGTERILFNGKEVYRLEYHGGRL